MKQWMFRILVFAGFLLSAAVPVVAQNYTLTTLGLTSSTPAAAAYSIRQLSTSYTGPLMRIYTATSFYDVYPDATSGALATTSLISAAQSTYNAAVASAGSSALSSIITAGTTNATVAIWYDQSGNGINVLQATTAKQPSIITNGTINTYSGKPTMYFNASNTGGVYFQSATSFQSLNGTPYTLSAVCQTPSGGAATHNSAIGTGNSGAQNRSLNFGYNSTTGNVLKIGQGTNTSSFAQIPQNTKLSLLTGIRNNTGGALAFLNGNASGSNQMSGAGASPTYATQYLATNSTTDYLNIGAGYTPGAYDWMGNISEVILFPSDLSASRSTFESNQSAYYDVPLISSHPSTSTQTLCVNATASAITITASATSSLSYQWYSNTTNSNITGGVSLGSVTGAQTSSYTPSTAATGTLYYYCIVTNATSGASTISNVSGGITVNALPSPTFTAQPGTSASVSTNVTYTTQSGQTNYIWTVPGTLSTDYTITSGGLGTTSNTVTLKWLTTGSKTVIINYTNANGCSGATSSIATTVSTLDQLGLSGIATAVAYSVRKLSSNYSGPLVRIYNGSSYYDVYPDATTGWIASTSLLSASIATYNADISAAGSTTLSTITDATVAVWYDQSGNARHIYQATTANQPIIIASSVIKTNTSGNPGIYFNGTSTFLQTTAAATWLNGIGYSIVSVLQKNGTGAATFIIGTNDGDTDHGLHFGQRSSTKFTIDQYADGADYIIPQIASTTIGTIIKYAGAGGSAAWLNGTPLGTNASPNANLATTGVLNVGTGYNTGGNFWLGPVSELLIFPNELSTTNRQIVESNQATNYSVSLQTEPIISVQPSTTAQLVCLNTTPSNLSVTANVSTGTISYQWYKNATNSNTSGGVSLGSANGAQTNTLTPITSVAGTTYYYCILTSSSFGFTSTSTVSGAVSVNSNPTFTAQPGATACVNTDVTYTTEAGQSNYIWTVPGTLNTDYTITSGGVGTTNNTVTLQWLTAGSKTVTINYTNAIYGCTAASATSSTATTVSGTPTTANAGADQTGTSTCGLTSVTLAGNTATVGTGAWSIVSGTGGTITTASSPTSTFSGTAGSSYTLRWTISNSPCTASTDDVVITFNQNPTAGITNNTSTTILTCTTTSISLTATGSGTYSWSDGSSVVSSVAALSVTSPATYTVTVTGANGCTATSPVIITQNTTAPTAGITNNTSTTVLNCTTTSISLTATGGGTYSWSDGSTVVGTSAALSVTSPGTYTVTVTGSNGCTATSAVTITQNTTAPTAGITNNTSTTVLNCTTTSISLTATGGGTYSWSDGSTVVGTSAALSVTSPATYTVTVTSSNGCTAISAVTITQNTTAPTAGITNNTASTVLTCTTTSISLTATGSGTYSWSDGSSVVSVIAVLSVTTPGTYTVTVTGSNGCTATSAVTITQNIAASTAAVLSGTATISNGNSTNLSVAFTGGTSPYTVVYSDGTSNYTVNSYVSGSNISVSPSTSTTYTLVSVTGANGCAGTGNSGSAVITVNVGPTASVISGTTAICLGSSTNINVAITSGTSPYTLVYSNGSSNTTVNSYTSGANISVSPTSTTTYTIVSVTDANSNVGTGNSGSAVITVNALPSITGTLTVCVNATTLLLGSATAASTNPWVSASTGVATIDNNGLVTGKSAGTSIITYTNSNGCSKTTVITVSAPIAGIRNNTSTTVLTSTVTSISLTSTGGSTYSWSDGSAVVSTTAAYRVTAPGTYTVTVTNTNGCSSTATITITQTSTPPATSITNNTGTTELNCTTTSISLTATGGGTYAWSDGSAVVSSVAALTVTSPGTYTVTVTNGGTTTSSITVTQNVITSATAVLTGSTTITSGKSANLQSTISIGNAPYTVVISDGTTQFTTYSYYSGPNIIVTPAATKTYTLVSVTGANGCAVTSLSGSAIVTLNSGGTAKVWTGVVGDDLWSTDGNWSPAGTPASNDFITIPLGTPQLDVYFTVNGSLTVNGTGTLTVNAGKSIDIGLEGVVDFGKRDITFKSTAAGTAQLGKIEGTLSNADSVIVERYFPAGRRAYRFISASVTTPSSIRYNWMENATPVYTYTAVYNTVSAYNPKLGYGTHITGTGDNANGFDKTYNNTSTLYTLNTSTQVWVAVGSTSGTLAAGDAYRVLIRGNRSINLNNNSATASATIMRTKGAPKVGIHTVSSNLSAIAGGWSLVGNPYQALVDLRAVSTTNLTPYYSVWDPQRGTHGAYVSYHLGTGIKSNIASDVNELVQPGQAFFVQTMNAGAATLTFDESNKAPLGTQTSVFRAVANYPVLNVALNYTDSLANGAPEMDAFAVVFDNSFSNSVDKEDAPKNFNQDENMGISRDGKILAMELRDMYNATTVIPMNMVNYVRTDYTMRINWSNPVDAGYEAYIKDNYTGAIQPIGFGINTDYVFTVNSSIAASKATDRFSILFIATATLPVSGLVLNGTAEGKQVKLQFDALNEREMAGYTIERSADGVSFEQIGEQAAVNGSVASRSYAFIDNKPISGNNYYRIKGNSINGQVQYSNIKVIKLGNSMPTVLVAPNPVNNDKLQLKVSQLLKGSYTVTVTDALGRVFCHKELVYDGVSGIMELKFPSIAKSGSYYVQVNGEGGIFTEAFIIR